MIKTRFFIHHAPLLLVLSLLLGGCFSPPSSPSLYTIAPITGTPLVPDTATVGAVVVIMPVKLAPFLQQTGLVTMSSPEQLTPSHSHLWSGALDDLCTTTIAQNMMTLLPNLHAAAYPGPRYAKPRFSIETELFNFSSFNSTFFIDATWTISDLQTKTIARQGRFTRQYPLKGTSYLEYANATSVALGDLTTQMAKALVIQQSDNQ